MLHLCWLACAVATWLFTRSIELYPYALVSIFLCGACIGLAACEREIRRARESEKNSWRVMDKMQSVLKKESDEK